jgi:hypothetical protein
VTNLAREIAKSNLDSARDYLEQAEAARKAGDRRTADRLYGNASTFFMQADPYGKPGLGMASAVRCQQLRREMYSY